jgi:hypothetical protein
MKQILLAIIFILCLNSPLVVSQDREWFKLAPIGSGFSVMMPAHPQEEVKTSDDLTVHLFTLRPGSALKLTNNLMPAVTVLFAT